MSNAAESIQIRSRRFKSPATRQPVFSPFSISLSLSVSRSVSVRFFRSKDSAVRILDVPQDLRLGKAVDGCAQQLGFVVATA